MIVGVCSLEVLIYEANSLKAKRSVVKSLVGRLKSRFNISIAETGYHDLWNKSEISFSCVSNDKGHCNQIISKVMGFIDGDERVEILNHNIEFL